MSIDIKALEAAWQKFNEESHINEEIPEELMEFIKLTHPEMLGLVHRSMAYGFELGRLYSVEEIKNQMISRIETKLEGNR